MSGLFFRAAVMWTLALLSGTAVFLGGGKAAWFIFGCVSFLALLGTIGSLLMKGDIRIERKLSAAAVHSGETLRIEAKAVLPFRFPLAFVIIREEWMNEQSRRIVRGSVLLAPLGRREVSFAYELTDLRRGVYRLRRLETTAVDYLHLSGYRHSRPAAAGQEEILVYPHMPEDADTSIMQRHQEDPALLGGLRAYQQGDSVRRIDWKSYLRRGKLMTKLSDLDTIRPILLILDPGADDGQFERAISAAAGFIAQALQTAGGEAEFMIVSGERPLPDNRGSNDQEALLRQLTRVRRRADIPLADLLEAAGSLKATATSIERILVTGRLDSKMAGLALAARASGPISVLYAANNAALSYSEHRMQDELRDAGCDFGYVPILPAEAMHKGAMPKGVPAYG